MATSLILTKTSLEKCTLCPRLAANFEQLREKFPRYWNRPVPASGVYPASLLIVGLAPGLHGANRTGKPFTGDASGDLLFKVLKSCGYLFDDGFISDEGLLSEQRLISDQGLVADQGFVADEGLVADQGFVADEGFVADKSPVPKNKSPVNCLITNAVKCVPPKNRPLTGEINRCRPYLLDEIDKFRTQLTGKGAILCLGGLSHKSVIKCLSLKAAEYPFRHGAVYGLKEGLHLVDSYHCSRYNTQTGRLSEAEFTQVIAHTGELLMGA